MYRLIRFGTTDITGRNQVDQTGRGETPTSYLTLPGGGALDNYGSAAKNPGVVTRSKQLRLVGTSPLDLERQYYRLMALVGKRDRLYRRLSSGAIQWTVARLAAMNAERSFEQAQFRLTQDVELVFHCQEPYWHGARIGSWTLDSGVLLDSAERLDQGATTFDLQAASRTVTVQVGSADEPGMAPVLGVVVRLSAGSMPIDGVSITRIGGGGVLAYAGTILAGGLLTIDTGLMQVTCTADPWAYDRLYLTPSADLAAWFSLLPGANQIAIACGGAVGADRAISFDLTEAWY